MVPSCPGHNCKAQGFRARCSAGRKFCTTRLLLQAPEKQKGLWYRVARATTARPKGFGHDARREESSAQPVSCFKHPRSKRDYGTELPGPQVQGPRVSGTMLGGKKVLHNPSLASSTREAKGIMVPSCPGHKCKAQGFRARCSAGRKFCTTRLLLQAPEKQKGLWYRVARATTARPKGFGHDARREESSAQPVSCFKHPRSKRDYGTELPGPQLQGPRVSGTMLGGKKVLHNPSLASSTREAKGIMVPSCPGHNCKAQGFRARCSAGRKFCTTRLLLQAP